MAGAAIAEMRLLQSHGFGLVALDTGPMHRLSERWCYPQIHILFWSCPWIHVFFVTAQAVFDTGGLLG
jgi:hypothetical protein